YTFLNRQFKLGASEPLKERPFDPVPPAELSVYGAGHPRPADEADAAGVRKWMTRASDESIAAIADDPAAYRAMLHAALSAMVVEETPPHTDATFTAQIPKNFNGKVVIWPGAPSDVSALLDAGAAVLPVDLHEVKFKPTNYVGFTLGYNRGAL